MELYGLIGILGTPNNSERTVFRIDKFKLIGLLDGQVSTLTLSEIWERRINVIGIPSEAFRHFKLFYCVYDLSIGRSSDSWGLGLVPVYYTDNPSKVADFKYKRVEYKTVWEYAGDIDAKSIEEEFIVLEFSTMGDNSWDDECAAKCNFGVALGIKGDINICASAYLDGGYSGESFIDANGKKLKKSKYYLMYDNWWVDDVVKCFVDSDMLLVKRGIDTEITQLIFEKLHIINPSFLSKEEIIVTSNKCKVVVIDALGEYDSMGSGWSLVIHPDIVKIDYCAEDFDSHKENNVKFYISRKINLDTFMDFVKSVNFSSKEKKGSRIIGFCDYGKYKDSKYKDEYLKCLELTKRINSNDTSDKLLNDIDYLVIKLNEIGFNIELY